MEGFKGDTVFLNDPALGKRSVPWQDFISSYTGVYLQIAPGPDFKREGHPYSIAKAVASKLMQDKWAMLFLLILGLCMYDTRHKKLNQHMFIILQVQNGKDGPL